MARLLTSRAEQASRAEQGSRIKVVARSYEGLHRRTQRILRRRFDKGFMTDGGFDALRTVLSGNMWPPWLAINSNNEYFDEAAVALGAEAAAERLERCFPGSPRDAPLGRPQRSTRDWPQLAPPPVMMRRYASADTSVAPPSDP